VRQRIKPISDSRRANIGEPYERWPSIGFAGIEHRIAELRVLEVSLSMREKLWLFLRRSATLRKLYSIPALSRPMRTTSFLLMPSKRRARVRVQTGPGKGLLLELNPRWEHSFWEGSYESRVQALFGKLLRPGMTFFDVGANFGYYSMLATRCGARAIAFEPDAEISQELVQHAKLNGLRNDIQLQRTAVFSYTGDLLLDPARGQTRHGNARIHASGDLTANVIRVPCVRLDDFVISNPVPALVKIDVEGAESEVLKGAERLFQSVRPFLICEIHDESNERFISAWLEQKKYLIQWLDSTPLFPRQLFAGPAQENESQNH
jgi:FkbM family methyltransferase